MKAKISLITLGVADLPRAITFYEQGLGLPRHPLESDGVAFFALNGSWLSLFPRTELANDIGIDATPTAAFSGITLAHNVASKGEVDTVLAQAVAAGGSTLKDFVNAEGRTGYFQLEAAVYGRTGEPCRVCATPIKTLRQGQRSTFYCPQCQKP